MEQSPSLLEQTRQSVEEVRKIHSENTNRAEGAALMWKIAFFSASILLLISLYDKYRPHDEWFPDTESSRIKCTHYGWLSSSQDMLQWRKDLNGDLGWCFKAKDGNWYAFRNDSE